MTSFTTTLLRITLAIIFCGAILVQLFVLPMFISEILTQYPAVAQLATPYKWVVVLGILCLQICLVAIWALLNKVEHQEIFSPNALPWIDTFISACVIAGFLVLALGFHLLVIVNVGGPGVLLAVAGGIVIPAGLALLMKVMRQLLNSAITMNRQLSASL